MLLRPLRLIAPFLLLAAVAAAGAPLFPKPLHVTRSISDSLSGTTTIVEEYFFGSRAVTVRGERSIIADYDRREITEVDRADATYSVTTFEQAASARGGRAPGKSNVVLEHIAVDASIELSRDAFDVVIGAAYPTDGGNRADLARGAARQSRSVSAMSNSASAADRYGLPLEQVFRWTEAGETVTSSNRITRVGSETVPPELVAIPAGARLVESRLTRTKRLSDEVDSLPAPRRH